MAKRYTLLKEEQYKERFGMAPNALKKQLQKAAFDKAWETRNFEIDKFWQRSMFFWGFIAAAFAGYVTIFTCERAVLHDIKP